MPEFKDDGDEEVVTDYAQGRKLKNPDDVCGFCSECHNVQSDSKMYRSVFAQEGVSPVCQYCGGVVIITYRELIDESFKNHLDNMRGIGSG